VSLARSTREAYECLQQNREVLVSLHKQASGGAVVASVDQLTGLANRAAFSTHLAARLGSLQPAGTLCLMLIELGALKLLASEIGPTATNRVIKRFAAILRRTIKRTDYVARLGSQHFAIVFENVLPEKSVSIALRIHDAIEAKLSPRGGPMADLLSVTMGIAGAAGPAPNTDDLMHKAYDAVAQARKEGRPAIYLA
jgi:diguanylate cyclase